MQFQILSFTFNHYLTVQEQFASKHLNLYYKKISYYYNLSFHVEQHEVYEKYPTYQYNLQGRGELNIFFITSNVTKINILRYFLFRYVTVFNFPIRYCV
jgi:hypothetical protein